MKKSISTLFIAVITIASVAMAEGGSNLNGREVNRDIQRYALRSQSRTYDKISIENATLASQADGQTIFWVFANVINQGRSERKSFLFRVPKKTVNDQADVLPGTATESMTNLKWRAAENRLSLEELARMQQVAAEAFSDELQKRTHDNRRVRWISLPTIHRDDAITNTVLFFVNASIRTGNSTGTQLTGGIVHIERGTYHVVQIENLP